MREGHAQRDSDRGNNNGVNLPYTLVTLPGVWKTLALFLEPATQPVPAYRLVLRISANPRTFLVDEFTDIITIATLYCVNNVAIAHYLN